MNKIFLMAGLISRIKPELPDEIFKADFLTILQIKMLKFRYLVIIQLNAKLVCFFFKKK